MTAHAFDGSSNIASYHLDDETGELKVMFHSGGSATHHGVPAETIEAWKQAPSAGKFYHNVLRGKFGPPDIRVGDPVSRLPSA